MRRRLLAARGPAGAYYTTRTAGGEDANAVEMPSPLCYDESTEPTGTALKKHRARARTACRAPGGKG